MGRNVDPCILCGGPRPEGLRKRVRGSDARVRRVAVCYSCKGVSGLDVPDRFRSKIRTWRPEAVQDQDAYRSWTRGYQLQVGDCRNLLTGLAGVDMFFTDPPYNIGFEYGAVNDRLSEDEYHSLMASAAAAMFQAARRDAHLVMVHYPEEAARLLPFIENAGWTLHQWGTWVYRSHLGAKGRRFSRSSRAVLWFTKGKPYFQDPNPMRSLDWFETEHVQGGSVHWKGYGCQIPPRLIRHWIEALTKPGALVADPFVGTGSTVKEAIVLGRYAWGCDLNPLATPLWAPLEASVDGRVPVPAGESNLSGHPVAAGDANGPAPAGIPSMDTPPVPVLEGQVQELEPKP